MKINDLDPDKLIEIIQCLGEGIVPDYAANNREIGLAIKITPGYNG